MTPVTLVTGPQLHTHPEELPGITPTLQAGHEALAWSAMDSWNLSAFQASCRRSRCQSLSKAVH